MENQPDSSPENSPENPPSFEYYKSNADGNSFQIHAQSKAMENCIGLFLKLAANASPTKSLSQNQKVLIEQRLLDSFLVHPRPDHLPYAAMIITAIEKLNEKGGSNDEAISQFIKKENHELPWAHDTFVKHHLDLLLKEGSVFKTRHGLYRTDDADTVSTDTDLYIPTSDSDDSSGSQSVTQKRKLSKGRILQVKVKAKRGRPRKMNTLRAEHLGEKNKEKKGKRGRPRKIKNEKEYQKKKEDDDVVMVDDESNTSRVNQESEKSKKTELTLVPSCNQTNADDRVDIGSEQAGVQGKQFDHKTNSQVVEETNQLQEHTLATVKE